MTNHGKQFRAPSPKKARRKRTPRCNSCRRRDGDVAGGEDQAARVHLKLCARCRGVAYCGIKCQKADWKGHREVCVQYPISADLPAPSPLVNHQMLSGTGACPRNSRRKVIYGGAVGTVGATPRQREKAPTEHPFFGRQESMSEREARDAVGQPSSVNVFSAQKRQDQQQQQQGTLTEWRRQQQQQQQLRQEHLANDEDGCPSPPKMQRLNFPGGTNLSWQPLRSGNADVTAASRARRSSSGGSSGVRSRGTVSSPPLPTGEESARSSAPVPVRRVSAPLYPVVLEKTKRWVAKIANSRSQRGPPPPYASVAHRAKTIKKSPAATGSNPGGGSSASDAASLPQRSSPNRGIPPSARAPPPLPPRNHVRLVGTASPPLVSLSTEQAAGTTTESEGRNTVPTPPVLAKDHPDGDSEDAAAGSSVGREDHAIPTRPVLAKDSPDDLSQDSAAGSTAAFWNGHSVPALPVLAIDTADSGDSAGSTAVERDDDALPTRPVLVKDSPEGLSQDSEAGSTVVVVWDDHTVRTPPVPVKDSLEYLPQDFAAGSTVLRDDHTVPTPPVPVKDSLDFLSQDSAAGSTVLRDDHTIPTPPVLASGSAGALSQDSAAGSTAIFPNDPVVSTPPVLVKDSADSLSQDSAAGSIALWDRHTTPTRPVLVNDSPDGSSQDSAAGSTAVLSDDRLVPTRLALVNGFAEALSQDSAAGSTAAQDDRMLSAQPLLVKGSSDGLSQDSAAGSAVLRDNQTVPNPPVLAKDFADGFSDDSVAGFLAGPPAELRDIAGPPAGLRDNSSVPTRAVLTNGSADALSEDSGAGSTAGQEKSAVQVRPTLTNGPVKDVSQDSAAGSAAEQESNTTAVVPMRFPMEPPPPIMPPSAVSNVAASGLAREMKGGVFDSCPPPAGPNKSSYDRSLSVGAAPQFHSVPLAVVTKGIAAGALAWNGERKTSPRPRPPHSPGPAALSQSSSQCSQKQSAVAESEDKGSKKTPPGSVAATFGRRMTSASPPSRTPSWRSLSSESGRASARPETVHLRSPPFVPAVELSPQGKTSLSSAPPGRRPTETAVFYRKRSGAPAGDVAGLPPSSETYLGRPEGFSAHVLVASAPTAADLAPSRKESSPGVTGGEDGCPMLYYSFDDRGRVAESLQPGDVVLVTPGRYEARAWGLQRLTSSVEIIGAGNAGDCVLYNKPAASHSGSPEGEHYLVGVMGGALGTGVGDEESVPEVRGKDDIDDDSDSGFEDGAFGVMAGSIGSFTQKPVRVRLANLTLEQGAGYRGAVYQLGGESHLEVDGCTILCSQGGVNVDQGTCVICDSTISGSQGFGVHIGGEGTVEHCLIRRCGQGGGGGGGQEASSPTAGVCTEAEDDGTDVNRVRGMPAVSVLQSSRVRVRFNVIRENAGHSLQYRDAPLPGGDGKYAMLARRAEAEAEERLRSWLGSAAVLLREHLQEQHREGSIVSEGNRCELNKGCDVANCGATGREGMEGGAVGTTGCSAGGGGRGGGGGDGGGGGGANANDAEAETPKTTVSTVDGEVTLAGDDVREKSNKEKRPSSFGDSTRRGPDKGKGRQTCVPTAEEEGLPLPAAMTLRFLAAMDEGYIGSRREENARCQRRRNEKRAG
ncbi:unnamed protein product [Pylaiella littoralis]